MALALRSLRTRQSLLIAIAVVAAGVLVGTRVKGRGSYDHMYARAVQRQYLRWIAYRITAYAREYGRPAFHLDSVAAHLDSAKAAEFRRNLVDIWDRPVYYWWDECRFILSSSAGRSNRDYPDDSPRTDSVVTLTQEQRFRAMMAADRRHTVREEYGWPPEARGRRNALGQFTK